MSRLLAEDAIRRGADPAAIDLGIRNWNFNPAGTPTNAATLTGGTIFCSGVRLPRGRRVTNIWLPISVAAAGVAPTHAYVGLGSPAAGGKSTVRALSSDLAALAAFGQTNWQCFPLSGQYATQQDGLHWVFLLVVGAWGTTQPTFVRGASGGASAFSPDRFLYATGGTGQAALPAIGAQVTLSSAGSPLGYCVGVS